MKYKWMQQDSNQQLSLETNTQSFSQTGQMIDFVVGTYLYNAFHCMFLSRHVRILDWICTPQLPNRHGTQTAPKSCGIGV